VDQSRLSQLTTQWTLIFEASRGSGDALKAAQSEVLERYYGSIYRYSLKFLGEADLAEEACQEFALRFMRGDFRHADPAKGRFRDYVKAAVIHLLNEFRRREQDRRRALALESGVAEAMATPLPLEPEDSAFQQLWCKELLNRAWYEMERQRSASGPPYHAALRMKADQPDLTAADLADRLRVAGKGTYGASGMRQILHRARQLFADRLLDEVARSVMSEERHILIEELIELDLLTYCREALNRRWG
jgi:DNA-directed RNA polymerase specialized sigma24 family protein